MTSKNPETPLVTPMDGHSVQEWLWFCQIRTDFNNFWHASADNYTNTILHQGVIWGHCT